MLNKVMMIGNLGKDPEVRQAGDSSVANFSIAVTEKFKDRNGQLQERTEWVNIVCWRRLAEIAQQYLRKGSPVYVEGKLQTRKWQDKDGNDRYTTEVVADNFQMLGGRRDGEQQGSGQSYERRQSSGGNNPFADNFQMLGSRQEGRQSNEQQLNTFAQPTTYAPRFAEGQNLTPAPEDDLPF